MNDIDHPDGALKNPSVRHERSDASFKAILLILVVAAVLGVLLHLMILHFFLHERAEQDAAKKSPFPLAPAPSTALPREPRLEQLDRLPVGDRQAGVARRAVHHVRRAGIDGDHHDARCRHEDQQVQHHQRCQRDAVVDVELLLGVCAAVVPPELALAFSFPDAA